MIAKDDGEGKDQHKEEWRMTSLYSTQATSRVRTSTLPTCTAGEEWSCSDGNDKATRSSLKYDDRWGTQP